MSVWFFFTIATFPLSKFVFGISICVILCFIESQLLLIREHLPGKLAVVPSSLPRPVSIRVANKVPMGSKGWPTQPSRLVMDVTPLWSSSEGPRTRTAELVPWKTRYQIRIRYKLCTEQVGNFYLVNLSPKIQNLQNETCRGLSFCEKRRLKQNSTLAKKDRPTFSVTAEKLQLLLLPPPQRVDDGDGQPQRLFGVTV